MSKIQNFDYICKNIHHYGTLNLTYEDLASVICLAVHLANADGNVTDDEMEENEKSLYWDIMDKCGLPDHNLETAAAATDNAQPEDSLTRQTAISINYKRVKADICDGAIKYVQWDRGVNVRDKVFGWFNDAQTLQFFRRSGTLKGFNYKSFIERFIGILYAIDNGIMVSGEENPELSRRYLETALTELENLQ